MTFRSTSLLLVLGATLASCASGSMEETDAGATAMDAGRDSGTRDASNADSSTDSGLTSDAGSQADAASLDAGGADAGATDAGGADAGTMIVPVYYVKDTDLGIRLYREFRHVAFESDEVRAAVDAMLHLPALDPDYDSLWPVGTSINSIITFGATATVDLSSDALTPPLGAEAESLSLQQLVYTVTAANNAITNVRLLVDGVSLETLWGHVDTSAAMTRAARLDVLAPVWIIDPQQGDSLTVLEASGDATVFEATVSWRIERACLVPGCSDTPFTMEGTTMADSGAPGRGLWSQTIALPEAAFDGDGMVRLSAWEASSADGSVLHLDDKVVHVTR